MPRLRTALDGHFPTEHISLTFPPPSLCTDNAAMIGWASMHRFLAGDTDGYDCDLRVKWDIHELAHGGLSGDETTKAERTSSGKGLPMADGAFLGLADALS